ncbi:MAG: hypothetical protein LBB68_11090 [Treponema sp.]|nr:hypothetical protein [Treponema sp.]
MDEILLASNIIINVTVPAAVAVAMGKASAEDAAARVEKAAYVTLSIPGGKAAALKVCKAVKTIIDFYGVTQTA